MGVTIGRVSQIEHGELAGIDVLDRYVSAVGGSPQMVAGFGDEQIKVGRGTNCGVRSLRAPGGAERNSEVILLLLLTKDCVRHP